MTLRCRFSLCFFTGEKLDGEEARETPSAAVNLKRRKDGDESLSQVREPVSYRRLITIFVIFFIAIPAVSIVLYKVKLDHPVIQTKSSIRQKGIVKLIEISKKSSLTSEGYDMAKLLNSKFTRLSPVWYDLKSQGSGLVLEGRHNADKGWIQELQSRGNALILPRVVLEAIPGELVRKKKLREKAINLIDTECKEMEYDGIVLESWSRWAAYGTLNDPDMRTGIRKTTWRHPSLNKLMGKQPAANAVHVCRWSTSFREASNNPGPSAPVKWIDLTLKLLLGPSNNINSNLARKVLLGINFYSNDYLISGDSGGGGATTGRDYLTSLQKHKLNLHWDKESGEHLFMYKDEQNIKHAVFYPTLMPILLRLENTHLWGIGISIWEIGQGLDYFFDLL